MNKMLLSLVFVLTSVGCAGSPKENILTTVLPCLTNVMAGTHDAVCNNHDLQRWEQWKQKNPHIGEEYERDLWSGKLYNKKAGPAPPHAYDSPNFACPRDWRHWCLD